MCTRSYRQYEGLSNATSQLGALPTYLDIEVAQIVAALGPDGMRFHIRRLLCRILWVRSDPTVCPEMGWWL
jgi:hypothetical protein